MPQLLAFDIGGTQIKYGIVSNTGEVIAAHSQNTCASDGGPALLVRLLELARPLVAQYQPCGIAISSLGLIEPKRGTVLGAAEAVPQYPGISLIPVFEAEFGLPVTAENDVNCVALAEGWTGAAQGVQDYLALAIGTGIGGGIVLGGHLHRGHRAAAGEWGYMNIGGQVWESQASMSGLVRRAVAASGELGLDGKAVFARVDAGDVVMQAVVADWLALLATGIANLIYAFNPEKIILGGGIAGRGAPFLQDIRAAVSQQLLPDFQSMTQIELASAGNHAGMLGAVRNWLNSNSVSALKGSL
ncbi:ROK family protein [Iodobacter sp. CM08]|uniref:ROK family protein n=1 Tax=Iodobacter sp. CM08 TaxID=3085902 RepID=UPI002981CB62|nr:ROK family protein [Iodobacter sp. CM08]MDW5417109.1 ROK family protein [Iodobacter sp. CM08]